jgi:hypothetical protein
VDAKWKDLSPDERLLAALKAAGPRPVSGTTDDKRNWGTKFADACAVMFANVLRENKTFRRLQIRPNPDGTGREALTGVGGRGQKKVDVIASSLSAGLQLAISLKAENFPYGDRTYGKNLKNRLYELQDEVRAIHEYQPRAYVVGVFFLPLDATMDRPKRSSFERAVANLRSRTGRIDFTLPTQLNRLDWSVVGLYVPVDVKGGPRRGVVRYFDVHQDPPRVGRPRLPLTLTLDAVIAKIATDFQEESDELQRYSEPESD